MDNEKTDLDLEWKNRTLCSDGNCIGVIGPDGRCKECGKPYEGALNTEQVSSEAASQDSDASHGEIPDSDDAASPDFDPDSDSEWENRQLCSDGNCIGVIGPDGRCKECGKPFVGDNG